MTLTVTRAWRALAAATLLAAPLATGLSLAAPGRAEATTIQKVVSPGGIEAWLVEEHTVPLIAVNFAFEGGSTQDPPGKEGLANLLSTLLDEGSGDLDSQAFQSRIEDISVNLSFEDSRDSFYGELKTLAEARDEAFDLLRLSVTSPRFDADAVERMRVQAINGARRELRDPGSIAGRATSKALFPNHPYGRSSNGTPTSLQAITRDDLVDYHRRVFARDGLKIAVVGAIDAKTLAPLLDKTFGGLPAKGQLTPVPDVVPVTGATVAEAMAVPQTTIRFATDGLLRKDPDFIAAFVMNHILGGGTFSSWLYEEVREKRGLAYSVSTSLNPLKHAGIFSGGLGTRPDKAQESLAIVREQIKRMAEQGPTADELAKAKAFLVGSYALRFDSSDKIAGQLLAIQIDDLGMDYFDVRNGLIEKVTLEDVKRVAQKLLSKPMTVVTVGPQGS
jgi:zinc protease